MSDRKPVLGDHKRMRSKLVTPFNDMLGPMRDVSWINTMVPELLWLALLHEMHGDRRAVEIATAFTRDVRAWSAECSGEIWAAAGKFDDLPDCALAHIVRERSEYADDMRSALAPLAAWYPAHPLNGVFGGSLPERTRPALDGLRRTVEALFDRSARDSMMVQATAMWLAFDSGRLKVSRDLALAEFPKIEDYPATEVSMRVGASIRSSLNMFFGEGGAMASTGSWPPAFWNRGLEIEACE